MITTEVALIMTAGMIASPLIYIAITQKNWFKREKFKYDLAFDRKASNIKFKRLEKDLNLKESPPIPPREKTGLELVQGINPDILKGLAGAIQTKDDVYESDYDEPERKADPLESILQFAKENPDLRDAFIEGISKKIPALGAKKPDEWKAQD